MPSIDNIPEAFGNLTSLIQSGASAGDILNVAATGEIPYSPEELPPLAPEISTPTYDQVIDATGDPGLANYVASEEASEYLMQAIMENEKIQSKRPETKVQQALNSIPEFIFTPTESDDLIEQSLIDVYVNQLSDSFGVSSDQIKSGINDVKLSQKKVLDELERSQTIKYKEEEQLQDQLEEMQFQDTASIADSMVAAEASRERVDELLGSREISPPQPVAALATQGVPQAAMTEEELQFQADDVPYELGTGMDYVNPDDEAISLALQMVQSEYMDTSGFPDSQYDSEYWRSRVQDVISSIRGYSTSAWRHTDATDVLEMWGDRSQFKAVVSDVDKSPVVAAAEGTAVVSPADAAAAAAAAAILPPTFIAPNSEEAMAFHGNRQNIEYLGDISNLNWFLDPDSRVVWGMDIDDNLYKIGELSDFTESNGYNLYSIGGQTISYDTDSEEWSFAPPSFIDTQAGVQAGAGTGYGGVPSPSYLASIEMSEGPKKVWETIQASQMGEDVYNPMLWGARMHGFQPAFEKYAYSTPRGTSFASFIQEPSDVPAGRWEELLRASASGGRLKNMEGFGETPEERLASRGRMLQFYEYLTGPQKDEYTVALLAAAMNAGEGMGGAALRRRLGTMYDVYSAQAASGMQPVGGFVSHFGSNILSPTTQLSGR